MNAPNKPVWHLLSLHWVSLAGSAIVTTAVLSFLFVLPLQMRGHVDYPYIGIIVFACQELIAMDEVSPEILKTLGLEERISRVQKK